MIKQLPLAVLFLLLIKTAPAQTGLPDSCRKYIQSGLSQWVASFSAFDFADFKVFETHHFDNNYAQDFGQLKSFKSVYKPILTFSQDSSKFIDIYSYQLNLEKKGKVYVANPEIDQAIFLCNPKTKYWDRIFFGGMSRWIDDAIFTSDSQFILVGIEKNDEDKNAPMIIVGDSKKQTLVIFSNVNKTCVEKKGYTSPKLNRIKITGL